MQQEPSPLYYYSAHLVRMIDADTYVLELDLGFYVHVHADIRLRGIDCPEANTPAGTAATAFAEEALRNAESILVKTFKTKQGNDIRSFSRYVADVWINGTLLADLLRSAGHEKPTIQ